MIEPIIDVYKNIIENLSYADQVGGLVKTAVMQVEAGEQSAPRTLIKRFPVDCNVSIAQCKTGRYTDLIPNDKYQTIFYFEDAGTQYTGNHGSYMTFRSNVILVGWLNLKKLGVNQCSVSSPIIADLISKLPQKNFNLPPNYQNIRFTPGAIPPKSPNLFSRYTYSEEVNQYLLFPFDYFGMNITIEYWISPACIQDFIKGIEDNCQDM